MLTMFNSTVTLGDIEIDISKDCNYVAEKLKLFCDKYNYRLRVPSLDDYTVIFSVKDPRTNNEVLFYRIIDMKNKKDGFYYEYKNRVFIQLNVDMIMNKEMNIKVYNEDFGYESLGLHFMCKEENKDLILEQDTPRELKVSFFDSVEDGKVMCISRQFFR